MDTTAALKINGWKIQLSLETLLGDIPSPSGRVSLLLAGVNCLKQFKRSLGQDKTKEINIGSVDQLMDDMADLQDEPSAEFCL